MPKPAKTKQVTLYLPLGLAKRVQEEGVRRRRKMGPAVIEILLEHFTKKADRPTWESTHCPYCGANMADLPEGESGAKHLTGACKIPLAAVAG